MRIIEKVIANDLCTSCGTCEGVCPNNAINMTINKKGIFIPIIDYESCSNCGLCDAVCPGLKIDFNKLRSSLLDNQSQNKLHKNNSHQFTGYASDKNIRKKGQSGGIVSALLIYAIENSIIDGVICTRWKKKNPLLPEVFIAKTKTEILSATGSKYCPVPINVILKKINHINGKFAYIGLPCQMEGLRKYEMINNEINKKIILHLGLFCDRTLSFHFQSYILKLLNINNDELGHFIYRNKNWKGWPGDIQVVKKNHEKLNVSKDYRIYVKSFFTPWRCHLCIDKLNLLSDIAIGDAWLKEFSNKKDGVNLVICNTEKGREILEAARKDGEIYINKISSEKINIAQSPIKKKQEFDIFCQISNVMGREIPKYNIKFNYDNRKFKTKNFIFSLLNLIITRLISYNLPRKLFQKIPIRFLKAYSLILK